MKLALSWTKVPLHAASPDVHLPLKRSSHSLVVKNGRAFIFGGEDRPREPVDGELYIVDLQDGSVSTSASALKPSARVGLALASAPQSDVIYLFGGREGSAMSACSGDLWVYSVTQDEWAQKSVQSNSLGDAVERRSYHVLAATAAGELFLHAGCPAQGRLGDLHALATGGDPTPLSTPLEWTPKPPAPGPERGGTVLCPVALPTGQTVLVRYGGFAGHELGGCIDFFDVAADAWRSIELEGDEGRGGYPPARSVHALLPIALPGAQAEGSEAGRVVALMLFGERGPAPAQLGHMGAGQFHADAWALVYYGERASGMFGFEEIKWEGEGPAARGWFAAGAWEGGKVVVHGGLSDSNERFDDCWIGEVLVQ
ncbi:hypothetical protein HWV62_2669 [Athelia sp. TMB]|nr:hypothetical protein HWV62_2669 [Athelia sp. TMB]